MFFNARSVCYKQIELSETLDYYNCDIVAICETWLNENVNLTSFGSEYQIFRQDRPNGIGGGILFAVKNHVICKLFCKSFVGGCECVFIDVQFSRSTYVRYGLVYRPPDTSFEDSVVLFNHIFDCLQNVSQYLLLGDFNLPDISWSDFTTRTQISQEFLTMCFKLGAQQCVDFSTRGNNILDLILCSDISIIDKVLPEPPFCTSDHISILCKMIYCSDMPFDNISKPCFKKADYGVINAFLATLNWDTIFENCNNTAEYWLAFKNVLNTVIYNFVPFVNVSRSKKYVPWFNNRLKHLRAVKQRKWRKYVNSRNIVTHAQYKQSAEQFRSEYISAKCNYEKNIFSNELSSGKFYGYVKSQSKVNISIPCIRKEDDTLLTSDYDKACEFLKYFSSVFVTDDNNFPDFNPPCTENLEKFTCNSRDIVKVVMKLKSNSCPGPDGISVFFVKKILAHIANPLCLIYNRSLNEGVLPEDWKQAYIVPIYKKGNPQLASQYRPVSLTSIFCKILERIIRTQLLDFMTRNNVIPENQHGFLPQKSTVTNLLECLDDWTRNFDNNVATDVIYLDYSKCFDKVSHNKLLYKLEKYGIKHSSLKWLKDFLVGREQCVRINQAVSDAALVQSGVPQGTVLGPLLFLIYSADVVNVVLQSKISMYADDTKLYRQVTTTQDCDLLQLDLECVARWADLWQMELNPEKTQTLRIGNCKSEYIYKLHDRDIERVSSVNDIGVTIQSDLKFTTHCTNVTRKAYFAIRKIFTIFKNHNYMFYCKLFTCYVRPLLEYSSQVWSPVLKCNIDRIEKVQRYYTRRILYLENLSYWERLIYLNLETLEERRIKSDLILFYKVISNDINMDLGNSYTFVHSYRGHNRTLFVNYCRTEKRRLYWCNRITNNWNSLDTNIVNSTSVKQFKKKLKYKNYVGRGSAY